MTKIFSVATVLTAVFVFSMYMLVRHEHYNREPLLLNNDWSIGIPMPVRKELVNVKSLP